MSRVDGIGRFPSGRCGVKEEGVSSLLLFGALPGDETLSRQKGQGTKADALAPPPG